ncbi:DNA-directed RNA polymerase subunit beta [Geobacillus sp. FSL W8-0032]|uniref:DNA-directed RNA polymerase subunit beta n=1 Tax=Geobacillus subterraneus TaxID=129338 RepID=A0A679FYF0_9BACL|nr:MULTISPECIES: DNA-directed RNA polymerase subunit beta [Geobacillus]KYD26112.1 hypothetical protein B4113_1422 [Geobacillus sp. B4113_201601]BBW97844.1 hypothetical protein GsuE55_26770 [Geobacillus subterraneus]
MGNETKNEPLSRSERRKQRRKARLAAFSTDGSAAALQERPPVTKTSPPSEAETTPETRHFARARFVSVLLRLIMVIALMVICLAVGVAVGYSVIGDGHWLDVFRPSTWQHIFDFVQKGA